ncbi:putative major intrinsic protein [Helianthus debilis subsp. tardiflorus]
MAMIYAVGHVSGAHFNPAITVTLSLLGLCPFKEIKKDGRIAVGMIIMLNVFVGGPISGASMNPTRSLGPAIVKWRFKGIWAYIFGPIIGAVIGGFVYKLLMSTENLLARL